MRERKVKLLGIAPYEEMKRSIERIAEGRTDLEIEVYLGDMNEGLEIVRQHPGFQYDAILSRGGTARLIKEISSIPVIEIPLSVYDILRSIRIAENYSRKYAIVGFPNITENAHLLCDILQYGIDIYTVNNESEVYKALNELKNKGITLILCDMIAQNAAHRSGIDSILFSSGAESIRLAFDQAVELYRSYSGITEENLFLRELLKKSGTYTIILSETGNVFLSTWEGEDVEEVYNMLRADLPQSLSDNGRKMFRTIHEVLYSVTSYPTVLHGQPHAIFYFSASRVPLMTGKYGIHFYNREEAEKIYRGSFYGISGAIGELRDTLSEISKSRHPVMLYGEDGTGKEQLARRLYLHGRFQNSPLVQIQCDQLHDKGWNYLINHYNSPLYDTESTIYFQNLEALSAEKAADLLAMLQDLSLSKKNQLIFSCTCPEKDQFPAKLRSFVWRLSCISVFLPPLRSRKQEIPLLANNYLATLNRQSGKDIIGFEPKALDYLEAYDWPHNYSQFKRVLIQLSAITATPYVSANNTASVMDTERAIASYTASVSSEGGGFRPLQSRTLEEINRDIIQSALRLNSGNQTKTARELGISRTTLWRFLRQEADA